MQPVKFYVVEFPSDKLWAPDSPSVTEAQVIETLIDLMSKHIRDNIKLVNVDPDTREIIP